jgi:sugar lactone lactonase YvrE
MAQGQSSGFICGIICTMIKTSTDGNLPLDMQTIWPAELDLGEGPMWHAPSHRFFFVAIQACALHAWSPTTDQRQSWVRPMQGRRMCA